MPKSRAASVTETPMSRSRFGVAANAFTIETQSLTCSAFATRSSLYLFGNGLLFTVAYSILYIVV
jgi:hypothetical protein